MKAIIKSIVIYCFFLTAINAYAIPSTLYSKNDPVAGNPNGKITVVEFFDYQCSHCKNMASTIHTLIQNNANLRVVFKDFPIFGESSELAARAALAAKNQGKYYPLHVALLNEYQRPNNDRILGLAEKLNLNMQKLKSDMQSSAVAAVINNTIKSAQQLNVTGTPAFFIGKTSANNITDYKFVMGEMSLDELQNAVDSIKK